MSRGSHDFRRFGLSGGSICLPRAQQYAFARPVRRHEKVENAYTARSYGLKRERIAVPFARPKTSSRLAEVVRGEAAKRAAKPTLDGVYRL